VNSVESVRLQANENVGVSKVVRLVEAQGAKMDIQPIAAKIVHTDIVVIVVGMG